MAAPHQTRLVHPLDQWCGELASVLAFQGEIARKPRDLVGDARGGVCRNPLKPGLMWFDFVTELGRTRNTSRCVAPYSKVMQ